MKIILFGANGMLGRYVYLYLKSIQNINNIFCITKNELDVIKTNIIDIDKLYPYLFPKRNCVIEKESPPFLNDIGKG